MPQNLVSKQTTADEKLVMSLRLYAVMARVLLQDIYQQAVREFLEQRRALKAGGSNPDYFANPKHQPKMNIRLLNSLADQATKAAREDDVSIAQLLNTALRRFVTEHPVQLPAEGEGQHPKTPSGRRKK